MGKEDIGGGRRDWRFMCKVLRLIVFWVWSMAVVEGFIYMFVMLL